VAGMALAAAMPGRRVTSAGEIPGIPGGNSSPDYQYLKYCESCLKNSLASNSSKPSWSESESSWEECICVHTSSHCLALSACHTVSWLSISPKFLQLRQLR